MENIITTDLNELIENIENIENINIKNQRKIRNTMLNID
jgi:hypothetical protein